MSDPRIKPRVPSVNWEHPLAKGLVGAWAFQDGGGSVLRDVSGRGNTGTLTNMDPATDWVSSPYGGALYFDGDNTASISRVQMPSASLSGGQGTLVFRFKFRVISLVAGEEGYIIDNQSPRFICFIDRFGTLIFQIGSSVSASSSLFSTDTWYSLALTWDEYANTREIYLDGSLVASSTAGFSFLHTDNHTVSRREVCLRPRVSPAQW